MWMLKMDMRTFELIIEMYSNRLFYMQYCAFSSWLHSFHWVYGNECVLCSLAIINGISLCKHCDRGMDFDYDDGYYFQWNCVIRLFWWLFNVIGLQRLGVCKLNESFRRLLRVVELGGSCQSWVTEDQSCFSFRSGWRGWPAAQWLSTSTNIMHI